MPYELDSTTDAQTEQSGQTAENGDLDQSLGVTIPEDHVGAFVAEAFEDPERSTTWEDVVGSLVAPDARPAWEELSAREQAVEVLAKADEYDERAVEHLDAVPLNADREAVVGDVEEALRCRRNADAFRDGLAAAYADGHLDDDALVGALEDVGFDTETLAEREDLLEQVDDAYGLEYRPYGGTLMDADGGPSPEVDHPETW